MKKVINEELIYEILSVVEEIPKGKVVTYGQIARLIGRVYFILNLCAKFSLKSQPSIYGKYGKWIL